jgi:hypothetical protein
MKKTTKNLILLNAIFATCLVIANIICNKIVQVGIFVTPAGVIVYPVTFLITDVIGENWGRDEANATVRTGFVCQMFALVFIWIAIHLPVAPFANNQAEFSGILSTTYRVTLGTLIAYICSQSWDVWVFHKIRDRYMETHNGSTSGKWIWNNASTMTSQIIDTVIFILIAFYGTVPNLLSMILTQYCVKFVYAALDTPIFYFLTREKGREGNV